MEGIGQEVIVVIEEIAARLGVAVEYIYPILLRQARIEGVVGVFMILLGVVLSYVSYRMCAKFLGKLQEDLYFKEKETYEVFAGISGILGVLFSLSVLAGILFSKNIITALFNPEWYIINNILGKLL